MLAEIITIGDEILIGQILDSNSAFIAKELNKIGIDVYQITSISDQKEHILNALNLAQSRVDVVILTGGLGPTKDDITKHTFCEFFKDTLVENTEVLEHIKILFNKYLKKPPTKLNLEQALVPSKSKILFNDLGTAPAMWMENDKAVFVSMPGVPYEMKGIVENHMIPALQDKFERPFIIHKTILTYGVGESTIAESIEDWENALPPFIKLAYLPSLGRVRLRLSARGKNESILKEAISEEVNKLEKIIGNIIIGFEEENDIEKVIGNLLVKNKLSLAIAESCTGGKIASLFTAIPGASMYFKGGIVPYNTSLKTKILGISNTVIKEYSVVSVQVAEEMALKTAKLFEADFAIATTGNAGPTKGDSDAEVGTVCILSLIHI